MYLFCIKITLSQISNIYISFQSCAYEDVTTSSAVLSVLKVKRKDVGKIHWTDWACFNEHLSEQESWFPTLRQVGCVCVYIYKHTDTSQHTHLLHLMVREWGILTAKLIFGGSDGVCASFLKIILPGA